MENEIYFLVEESDESGYTARALGISIFTQGDDIIELRENIKEAVLCHFDDNVKRVVRLRFTKEEVMSV
jgi:hypothetical protein